VSPRSSGRCYRVEDDGLPGRMLTPHGDFLRKAGSWSNRTLWGAMIYVDTAG
jgi:hypothetical protein